VGAVAALTQSHLEPVRAILQQFSFSVRSFHSDNGSEFINDTVAGLLKDLLIEQTKSRPRQSHDNGLVESTKRSANPQAHGHPPGHSSTESCPGARHPVVCESPSGGYGYIAAAHAEDIGRFYQRHFNPYLNFPRPCGPPERIVDERGKEKYVCRRYATPWETLRELSRALPQARSHLKPELSIQSLDRIAAAHSGTKSARESKKPNESSFSPSGRSVKALETAARFPHSHRAGDGCLSNRKTNPKTQEMSPADRAPELHPFTLILGLENAPI
jgi:hypothetical protein